MERIVFNQQELDKIGTDTTAVALCDNDYTISPVPGRTYLAIGTVNAVVKCTAIQAISIGLTFINFTPVFDGTDFPAPVKRTVVNVPASFASSFSSSFKSSFAASFNTSFTTSFSGMYEYEYEYRTSSFKRGSFSGSFTGGSMRLSASFATGSMRIRKRMVVREIAVNGYGLNLI